MKLLIDTNAFIWVSREPQLLSRAAHEALSDPYNERYVSVASIWEMQIKHALGKLPVPANVDAIAEDWMDALAARLLSIDLRHIGRLYELPAVHRDPFDRILVAQARAEGMSIISSDAIFHQYAAPVVW